MRRAMRPRILMNTVSLMGSRQWEDSSGNAKTEKQNVQRRVGQHRKPQSTRYRQPRRQRWTSELSSAAWIQDSIPFSTWHEFQTPLTGTLEFVRLALQPLSRYTCTHIHKHTHTYPPTLNPFHPVLCLLCCLKLALNGLYSE